MFQPLRLFLAASEHLDEESLSVISTGSPPVYARMWDVSPTVRSVKLQLVYDLKVSETATLDTFTVQTFYLYVPSQKSAHGRCTLRERAPRYM